jgi:hypothetical protein
MGLNMITKSLNYHNLSEPEGHEHCVVIEIRPIYVRTFTDFEQRTLLQENKRYQRCNHKL